MNTGSPSAVAIDCVFDTAGYNTSAAGNFNLFNCTVMNSGSQIAGTQSAISVNNGGSVTNCLIKDQRWNGIYVRGGMSPVVGNIIQNCAGIGIDALAPSGGSGHYTAAPIMNNTVHACGSHGIRVASYELLVTKNLITGIVGAGAYGLNTTYSAQPGLAVAGGVSGNNFSGCTTNCNISLMPSDTTLDPQYVNAPTDLTPTNTALRYLDGVGV